MRKLFAIAQYLILLFVIASRLDAQVIDRIMAVVNGHIITLSDVNRERQIREVLADKGPSDDQAILHDLIDAQITDDEIAQAAIVDVSEQDVERELSRVSDRHGLQADVLREAIRRRLQAEQFFDVRFRQLIRVTDDEVRQYYENVFVPEARKRGVDPIPPLDQVSEIVQKGVLEEKTMQQVENWLTTSRQRSDVEIFP